VDRSSLFPVAVDVIAEVLDQLWYLMRSNRLMSTPRYINAGRSPRPSVRRYSVESIPVEMKKLRRAKAELPFGMEKVLHHFDYGIKLAESI
jgi:hypothetical protein